MEGYGGPAQPSPTIGQCLNGGKLPRNLKRAQAKRRRRNWRL
jgi:hypothetical protein